MLTREIGWAILHAGWRAAPTIVVFAEKDDMVLLGALGLESMNLRIDLPRKQLVPAGPVPVAGLRVAWRRAWCFHPIKSNG